jgi:hypothetical protein
MNTRVACKCGLQEILETYDNYIEQLLKSKYYKEFREYCVLLKILDAAISFCNSDDTASYLYLKKGNKPFSFDIVEGFKKTLLHIMTFSHPLKESEYNCF